MLSLHCIHRIASGLHRVRHDNDGRGWRVSVINAWCILHFGGLTMNDHRISRFERELRAFHASVLIVFTVGVAIVVVVAQWL